MFMVFFFPDYPSQLARGLVPTKKRLPGLSKRLSKTTADDEDARPVPGMSQANMNVDMKTVPAAKLKSRGAAHYKFAPDACADLLIRCEHMTFQCHMLVVCEKSSFFNNALKPEHNFKEARTGIIRLVEDEAPVVQAMLRFIYNGDYRDARQRDACGRGRNLGIAIFHAKVYALAAKYDVQPLKELARKKFLPYLGKDRPLDIATYKYCVHRLVEGVYNSTPESDRGLRDAVMEYCARHAYELWECEPFWRYCEKDSGAFEGELWARVERMEKRKRVARKRGAGRA
ncbi:hypothetical protein SLS57_003213 [Botryosphaeria dothidea]